MAAGQKPAIMIALAPMALACQTGPRMPSPESAFGGTTWRVVAIGDRGALDEAPTTLTFEKSGERVAGSTGCNNYFATVQILGSGMRFEKAGSTRRGCPAAIAVQESPFLDALNRVATHSSIGEFLELLDESGIVLIRLRRAGVSPDGSQFADPTATAALAADDFVCSPDAATAIFHEDVIQSKGFQRLNQPDRLSINLTETSVRNCDDCPG